MFNQSSIIGRIEAGEFTLVPRPKANLSKKPNHPKDTRSQHLVIQDQNGDEIGTAHYYVCPAGPVTEIDPKTLKIGNLRYTVNPEPAVANPESQLPFVWMRKCYGWVRRNIICPVFGPLAVLPQARTVSFSEFPFWLLPAHVVALVRE